MNGYWVGRSVGFLLHAKRCATEEAAGFEWGKGTGIFSDIESVGV